MCREPDFYPSPVCVASMDTVAYVIAALLIFLTGGGRGKVERAKGLSPYRVILSQRAFLEEASSDFCLGKYNQLAEVVNSLLWSVKQSKKLSHSVKKLTNAPVAVSRHTLPHSGF